MGRCYSSCYRSEEEIREEREKIRNAKEGFEKFAKTGKIEIREATEWIFEKAGIVSVNY